ncbi:MFS transporter [Dendrosporobacter sp. 1207_IL3150]|uniref:MFS transporter n=1 Tax=Dendrosporobacter sp. 1207_IL3150 TaxID=3084054 RepID=UPI002FD9FD9D
MFQILKEIPSKVWLLVLAHCITDLSQGSLLVALPYFKFKFGLSYAEVGSLVLIQNLTSSVSQPLFGYFSDKYPRPWLIPAGCLLSGIAMFGSLLAPSFYLLYFSTALCGLGIAAFHPEAAKMANKFSGTSKGKGVSLFVVGGNGGFALGSLFMAILLSGDELMKALYLLPFIAIFYPLYKLAVSLPTITSNNSKQLENKISKSFSWPLAALLGVVLSRSTVGSGVSTFLPLYYVTYLHGSQLYASSLLTVYLAAGAVGTLFGGFLSDRYGSKRIMLWSILPISAMLYLFRLSEGFEVFLILSITSALLSCAFSSTLVLAQQMMPNNIAVASGLTIGLSVGLGAMGAVALGKVADIWSMPVVFDILAVLPLIGFLLTFYISEPNSKNPSYAAVRT